MRWVVAALALVTLLWRTGAMDTGYWIDEAISVGIASYDLHEIPRVLRQDGSPPLYYLLLHGWMAVVGSGEAATRALSLVFALLAVPAAWWAGRAAFDNRAGALAAAGAAGCPFLTYYAQETRMYSLVVVLSLLACGSFVLAFLHGRRRHLIALGVWLTLLLYTHTWGLFLTAGMAVAWVVLYRRGTVNPRDGARLAAALALAYAPWLPTLAFQATHTAAPWAGRPDLFYLLGIPGALFGYAASALLVIAVLTAAWRRVRRPRDEAMRALATVVVATALIAWLCSQIQPAWAPRYLAVLFGPLLVALAATVSRGTRWTAAALAAVAAVWAFTGPPPAKSNVRAVAAQAAIRPGDLVVSTQPEQVPVLHRYLPDGVVYLTPLGVVPDPRLTDWRDGLERLRAGHAETTLTPLLDHLDPGTRILLVTPVTRPSRFEGPWTRVVRRRTREWRAALRTDPRLRAIESSHPRLPRARHAVRSALFEVR